LTCTFFPNIIWLKKKKNKTTSISLHGVPRSVTHPPPIYCISIILQFGKKTWIPETCSYFEMYYLIEFSQ
jgi:hypothetical protein